MKQTKRIEDIASSERDMDVADVVEERVQLLLKEGANSFMDLQWLKPELPPFFDKEKFDRGQQAFYKNPFTMMIAKLSGLLTLLAVPSILNVLMLTKQSGKPCTAFRRYVSTILHTWTWYGRKPGLENEFLDSLKIVRKKHCVAFRRSFEAGFNRVTQLDMALAQFGFIGFTLLSGDFLGLLVTHEELEGLVHFWHVIGSMLGMEDRFNICRGTIEETRALCRRLLDEVFLPALSRKNKNFVDMSRTLIEGLWPVTPHLDADAFLAFTLNLASSAASNNNHSIVIDTSNMSLFSRFILNFQLFVHQYLMPPAYWWSSFFRGFFNGQMRLAIFLTEHFPFLAYWPYGIKDSHVRIFKYHVD